MLLALELSAIPIVLNFSVNSQMNMEAKAEFPGLVIKYKIEGGPWTKYTGPVPVTMDNVIQLRTETKDGTRTSLIRTLDVGDTSSGTKCCAGILVIMTLHLLCQLLS